MIGSGRCIHALHSTTASDKYHLSEGMNNFLFSQLAIFKYLLNSHQLGKLRKEFLTECEPVKATRISSVCEA